MMDGRTAQFVHAYIAGRADGGLALGAAVSLFLQQPNWLRDHLFWDWTLLILNNTMRVIPSWPHRTGDLGFPTEELPLCLLSSNTNVHSSSERHRLANPYQGIPVRAKSSEVSHLQGRTEHASLKLKPSRPLPFLLGSNRATSKETRS